MKSLKAIPVVIALSVLLPGCSGTRVDLGDRADKLAYSGSPREIAATACGFQLLLVIPIGVNDRLERANQLLRAQAGGEPIISVQMKESWTYGFVGRTTARP